MKIFLHDRLVEKEDAKVSVFDHGLLYGDGVFEGIRVYGGNIFRYHDHIDRLFDCARYLMLQIPLTREELERATIETIRANNVRDGYIRMVVTRGEGSLGLMPDTCKKAGLFIICDKIALYSKEKYETGLKIWTAATRRNSADIVNPRLKSLNYLNNILAKMEARMANCDEALMLDVRGFVTECSGDNIFVVKKNVIVTPPTAYGALNGITRGAVIELAEQRGYQVEIRPFTRFSIIEADECFLTGTAAEVVPAVALDGRVIGDGKPGPITRELTAAFHAITTRDGVKVYEEASAKA